MIDLPFKVEEHFTNAEGHEGYKFLQFKEGFKIIYLEMMGVRTNFQMLKGKQNDFEVVDEGFTAPSNFVGSNRNHTSNKRKKNDYFHGYNGIFDMDEDL